MAIVKSCDTVHITAGNYYDDTVPSPAACPGSYGYQSIYFYLSTDILLCTCDDHHVYLGLGAGGIGVDVEGINKGAAWPLYFKVSQSFFSGYVDDIVSGSTLLASDIEPIGGGHSAATPWWNWTAYASAQTIGQALSGNWYDMGDIDDLVHEDDKVDLWVAFPVYNTLGSYNQVTISGYKIQLTPEDVPPLFDLDYFPWAIRKTDNNVSTWESCNRANGSLQIRKSGSWRDAKNKTDDSDPNSTVHQCDSFSWIRCAKIGLNG